MAGFADRIRFTKSGKATQREAHMKPTSFLFVLVFGRLMSARPVPRPASVQAREISVANAMKQTFVEMASLIPHRYAVAPSQSGRREMDDKRDAFTRITNPRDAHCPKAKPRTTPIVPGCSSQGSKIPIPLGEQQPGSTL
jgi:hypothetical protein